MRKACIGIFFMIILTSCQSWTPGGGSSGESRKFENFLEKYWAKGLKESPEFASTIGERGHEHLWSDYSYERIQERKEETKAELAELKGIDRSNLTEAERISYDLYLGQLEMSIESQKFPSELMPMSQMGGPQTFIPMHLLQLPRKTTQDRKNLLTKLESIPQVLAQYRDRMERGMKEGIMPSKHALVGARAQLQALTREASENPIFKAFKKMPAAARGRATVILNLRVRPAARNFYAFFTERYMPMARKSIGLSELPQGKAWYQYLAKYHTTTPMTPREIHNLGLKEVKRIKKAMVAIKKEVKFDGSFKAFTKHLKSHPRYFYKKREDLINGYRQIAKKVDPYMIKLFLAPPRLPYGIRPIPSYKEKTDPAAYYERGSIKAGRPGYFMANAYDLKSRPKWDMVPLTLHEAVPGHHLQISYAQELEEVPQFRKYMYFNSYIEGWGLYSEQLGYEMDDIYSDPYDRFGQLNFEMWRAIRLVVDTGMHALGWSRKRARAFARDNGALTEKNIRVEIDRYIAIPGQALGYKVGELTITGLKKKWQKRLGENFDLRKFHEAVLENGTVPMDFLKKWVDKKMTP